MENMFRLVNNKSNDDASTTHFERISLTYFLEEKKSKEFEHEKKRKVIFIRNSHKCHFGTGSKRKRKKRMTKVKVKFILFFWAPLSAHSSFDLLLHVHCFYIYNNKRRRTRFQPVWCRFDHNFHSFRLTFISLFFFVRFHIIVLSRQLHPKSTLRIFNTCCYDLSGRHIN